MKGNVAECLRRPSQVNVTDHIEARKREPSRFEIGACCRMSPTTVLVNAKGWYQARFEGARWTSPAKLGSRIFDPGDENHASRTDKKQRPRIETFLQPNVYVPIRRDITSLSSITASLTARIPRRMSCSSTAKGTWTLEGMKKKKEVGSTSIKR